MHHPRNERLHIPPANLAILHRPALPIPRSIPALAVRTLPHPVSGHDVLAAHSDLLRGQSAVAARWLAVRVPGHEAPVHQLGAAFTAPGVGAGEVDPSGVRRGRARGGETRARRGLLAALVARAPSDVSCVVGGVLDGWRCHWGGRGFGRVVAGHIWEGDVWMAAVNDSSPEHEEEKCCSPK